MRRHATVEELACLELDGLKRRKAAKIRAHVASCAHCTDVIRQLDGVPDALASASVLFPPMPQHLSARIEASLTVEAHQRLAAMPATEGGRRDLPARRSMRADRAGAAWRLPGFSVGASRVLAGAGALAVIGGGGYLIANTVGSTSSHSVPSAASNAAPGEHAALSFGSAVRYRQDHTTSQITTVHSNTNFTSGQLAVDAVAAVDTARAHGIVSHKVGTAGTGRTTVPSATQSAGKLSANANSASAPAAGSAANLTGCVDLIAAGRPLLLVEIARYEGRPATIIVVAATAASAARVWVVGNGCSATGKDVLASLALPGL